MREAAAAGMSRVDLDAITIAACDDAVAAAEFTSWAPFETVMKRLPMPDVPPPGDPVTDQAIE